VAVQHGGHLAGAAGSPSTTLAELGAELGADTDTVLREVLELSPKDIAALHRSGAIG